MKVAAALLICFALAGCAEPPPTVSGSCAELFDGALFKDLDGREARLPCQGQTVMIVNFWASWCGPCKLEVPHLNEIAKQFPDRSVKVVGISLDAALPATLKSTVAALGIAYPVLTGSAEKIFQRMGIDGIPATLIIAPDGSIHKMLVGYHSKEELLAPVRELLQRKKGETAL